MVDEDVETQKEGKSKVLEGAEELLVEWGYALNQLAFSSRKGFNAFREIEIEAATHWLQKIGKLPETKTAYESATKFRDIADEKKIILKKNFKLEEKGEIILGTFLSQDCPYKKCCMGRKKEGKKFICFRATPFVTAIKLMAGKNYKSQVLYDQTTPGKFCIIKGAPTEIPFKVSLSYKLGVGTVKIHDLDCKKLGIGVVDSITIKPSREEISDRKLTVMSYSQTKYSPGMIIMNMADAKSLGLEEDDTVFVKKSGEKEETTLVKEERYEVEEVEKEVEEELEKKVVKGKETPKGKTKEAEEKQKEEEVEEEKVEELEKEEEPESNETTSEIKKSPKLKKLPKVQKKEEHERKEFERKINNIRHKS